MTARSTANGGLRACSVPIRMLRPVSFHAKRSAGRAVADHKLEGSAPGAREHLLQRGLPTLKPSRRRTGLGGMDLGRGCPARIEEHVGSDGVPDGAGDGVHRGADGS